MDLEARPRVSEAVLGAVRSLVREVDPQRDLASVGPHTRLEEDLGLGSVERADLVVRLEGAIGGPLADQSVVRARTVQDLMLVVRRARGASFAPAAAAEVQPPAAPAAGAPLRAAESLADILARLAEANPSRLALRLLRGDEVAGVWTRGQLWDAARVVASGLADHGVAPGDRVAIMLPSGLDFVAAFFGASVLGAVPVPLYPPLRPEQTAEFLERQAAILSSSGARLLVALPQVRLLAAMARPQAPALEEVVAPEALRGAPHAAPVAVERTAPALIQYTSGSMGAPRGVVVSHGALLANLDDYGERLGLGPDDVCLSWLPLYHDMGLIGMLLGSLYYGLPLTLMGPEDFLGRPMRWLRAIQAWGVTVSAAPNFAYEICARKAASSDLESLDLSRWRVAANGSEPVVPETLERFAARFAACGFHPSAFLPAYGLAEAALVVTAWGHGRHPRVDAISRTSLQDEGRADPPRDVLDAVRFVSCGHPLRRVEVRVVDEAGRPRGERLQGRVQFRGPNAMSGYFGDAAATASVRDDEGWVDTGDLGYQADGELFLTGRRKAVVLKGGRSLHAEDVERTAWEVHGVRRGCVAAFGVPDPALGTEALVLVVEARAARSEGERRRLGEAVARRVGEAVGIRPDRVVAVAPRTIRKTPSGKIRRALCRRQYLEGRLERAGSVPVQIVGEMVPHLGWWLQAAARASGRGAYGAWCGLWVAAWWLVVAGAGALSHRLGALVAHPASRLLLILAGLRLEVRGRPPAAGPVLLAANHGSVMDPVVMAAACRRPIRFVAAPWVARHRLLAPLVAGLRAIPVTRGDAAVAAGEVARMEEALAEGACVLAFAEGGLEASPGLRPFVRGPFRAAADGRAPVVPVAIEGTRRALRWGRLIPQPGRLRVTFLDPLRADGDGWGPVAGLARAAHDAVAAHCGEPTREQPLLRRD